MSTSVEAFDTCLTYLRERLRRPLPGTEAQLALAPAYRQDPRTASVTDKPCREASVLVLLFPLGEQPALVLTARRPDLEHHAGQISFPGGRREPGENLVETALREAHEEVGLPHRDVQVLGRLTPLYIPPSNFCVHPFVGAVSHAPSFQPEDAEVALILCTQLRHLLDPGTLRQEPWMLRGQRVIVPFYDVDGYKVWGATAMMLSEFLALFSDEAVAAHPE